MGVRDHQQIEPWKLPGTERRLNQPARPDGAHAQVDADPIAERRIGEDPPSEEIDQDGGVTQPRHGEPVVSGR